MNRYQTRLRDRFPAFLTLWLAELPTEGWGPATSSDLWEHMNARLGRSDLIPAPKALVSGLKLLAGFIASHGFDLHLDRTATARTIAFVRHRARK